MSNPVFSLREFFRNIQIGGWVEVVTALGSTPSKFVTKITWDHDLEPILFETSTIDEAIQKHEMLCKPFRKYTLLWKAEEVIEQKPLVVF